MLGSYVSSFSIRVWVLKATNSNVTYFSALHFSTQLVAMLTRPIGGVLADKISKKALIVVSDLGALAVSIVVALTLFTSAGASGASGSLAPEETQRTLTILFSACALYGALEGIQDPAFSSSLVELVPEVRFGYS